MRLSVLDQSTASKGRAQDTAIRETLELARHCDALGYHRYWLSEHHNSGTIVGAAPEILMAAIAARTARIRIGSAGVMLPHYSAFKVAEQFRVLEALAPGRIDLGADAFPEQVRDLQAWTAHGTHLGVTAHPLGPHAPELWILGSSDYGAQL